MRKKILLMLSVFCFIGATVFGQAIEGGAGIIHVDGNPNMMTSLNTVTVNEGNVAYDKDTQTAYYYDPTGTDTDGVTAGTHWLAVDISNLVDPITSIVVTAGDTELTATTVSGVTTLSFESDATISFDATANELTFTDLDGDATTIDISGGTVVEAADPSVTVTGAGTTASPYQVSLTGANGATAGTVPVTDGTTGALTWTNVVKNAAVNSDGTLELTFSDNSTANLDLDNAPKVANQTQLDAAAAALGVGETGIAVAADNNTFGMPATSNFGVIFFIKK